MNYGDIIGLGRHRLMCGDATNTEDVHALVGGRKVGLVLTDPPYGINIQSKDGTIGGNHHLAQLRTTINLRGLPHPVMIGDDSSDSARENYHIVKTLTDRLIIWGGQYFADFLPVSGGWLFWNKRTGNSDFSDGELAWRSWGRRVKYYEQLWNGIVMRGSFTLNGRVNAKGARARLHPTQKPVELHVNILEDFSQPEDVILDCFGGSGTTLIAAEVSGRTCLMMELSPEYCGVIIDRYIKLTQGTFDFRS